MAEDRLDNIVLNVWQGVELCSGQEYYEGAIGNREENYNLDSEADPVKGPRTLKELAKYIVNSLAEMYQLATKSPNILSDIAISLDSNLDETEHILILSSGVYRAKPLSDDDLAILGLEISKELQPYFKK